LKYSQNILKIRLLREKPRDSKFKVKLPEEDSIKMLYELRL
jgi:hypothetical protein